MIIVAKDYTHKMYGSGKFGQKSSIKKQSPGEDRALFENMKVSSYAQHHAPALQST